MLIFSGTVITVRWETVADPGSEKRRGSPGFWGLATKIFFVNCSQFRGLFIVFAKK